LFPPQTPPSTCKCLIPSTLNLNKKPSGSVISSFYPSTTPSIPAALSTTLASALHSVETTWRDSPAYTSANEAIFSAAPSSVQSSISKSGYYYKDVMTQSWYMKNVPQAVQTAVSGEVSAIDSVAEKLLGTLTSSSKGGAERTAVPLAMGIMAIVGGVLAIL
jgi:hypothetical protein